MSVGAQTKAKVDKLLSDVSNGLFPEYISEQVFTPLSVKQKTGLIGSYGTQHLRVVQDLVAGRSHAQRVDSIDMLAEQTYHVKSHALEDIVTEDDYDNEEDPFDPESDRVLGVTHLIMTNKERALAAALLDNTVLTNGVALSGSDQLDDYGNSNPTELFKEAHNEILDNCGKSANAAVMSKQVFNTLIYHPEILAKLGFSANRAGILTKEELARAMNIEQLFVGDAAYESAKEGQTSSLAQIWGKGIVFYVRPQSAGKKQIALGYYCRMKSRAARQVYKYPLNNPVNSTGIIVKDDYSFEIVNPDAAYLIETAIS
jgi:hypothetical protein